MLHIYMLIYIECYTILYYIIKIVFVQNQVSFFSKIALFY